MAPSCRPFRSVLYIPASNPRALDKARLVEADAIIFDLEDAVAPAEKSDARQRLVEQLAAGGFGHRALIVRINGFDTVWGRADAEAFASAKIHALLLPKVGRPADLDTLTALAPSQRLWAMIETPQAVLNAGPIAAHPKLAGLVLGTNDLAKDLNARLTPGRQALLPALGMAVLAARAYGRTAIDGVFPTLRDDDGLAAECRQGRDLGFDGKTLIHPDQISAANAAFGPSNAELDLARRQIEAFEAAEAEGRGVAVVDGRIVENLHVATARRTLDLAEAIAQLAR